jgi:Raf kinase inhibitor-like YbhB/YbcL family protein
MRVSPNLAACAEGVMFTLSSSAFAQHTPMPRRYTADGENVSPPLQWSDAPAQTKSFALIVDDPDAPDPRAPRRTWVHWVLYDIPASTHALAEDSARHDVPAGTRVGMNDWQHAEYGGPAPPIGRHRYFHTLYALDTVLPDLGNPTKAQLLKAMQGHVLAEAQLVGTYQAGH